MSGDSATPTWHPRRRLRGPWLLGILVFVIAGLGLAGCTTTQVAQDPPPANSSAAAGSFTAQTVDGGRVSVPSSKPSVLFFFSTACPSCGAGSTVLADVQRGAPQGANYVAVDVDPSESAADITSFLSQNNASALAFATDKNAQLIIAYQVQNMSTVVVLDASGTVVFRGVDPSAAQIREALTKAGTR